MGAIFVSAPRFPWKQPDRSIGKAMSSGCICMANEDVEHLYADVQIGATVVIRD
ncbi:MULTISPECIES: L,D-transpeptidase family protein [unclassified Ensifer]|uniref:L,D-transpeptidase family protein n=1 Tax=unclassified Ensifer TaxID=2633371 RepID=UPI00192A2AD5